MPGYNPNSYNVIMLLQNEEQNQLDKIVRLKDESGRLVTEYKTFPDAAVGEVCLRRTFIYDKLGTDLTAEAVFTDVWSDALESIVNPVSKSILSINLSQLIVPDGAPAGTKIADIATIGGNPPFAYSIVLDPSSKFKVLGSQLYLKDVSDIADGSYDLTLRVTDLSGSTFTQAFTLPVEDQTPTDITLSSSVIFDGATSGEVVGTLTAEGTHLPITFVIQSDPSNKFTISDNNKLTLDNTVDIADGSYNVTVRAIDCLLGVFDKLFVITVDSVSVQLSNTQVIHDSVYGTKVATISGGSLNLPVTFSIVADPSNKFEIADSNELILQDTANIADVNYSVTIRGTDSLLNTHDEVFTIKVVSREDFTGSDTQYFEGTVDEDIKGTAIMWETSGNTLVPVSSANPLPIALSTTPVVSNVSIYNVASPGIANTEFSQALTDGTTSFTVRVRGTADLQFAFTSSFTEAITVPAGASFTQDNVNLQSESLYMKCSKASQVIEILEWS